MPVNVRPALGPMVAALCLQKLQTHTGDLVGMGTVVGAGRLRGRGVIAEYGLSGSRLDDDKLRRLLLDVLGPDGTRLCLVTGLVGEPGGGYEVRVVEAACTHEVESDEPMCAYTLGVFIGAVQEVMSVVMQGVEVECQATGAPECVYRIRPLTI